MASVYFENKDLSIHEPCIGYTIFGDKSSSLLVVSLGLKHYLHSPLEKSFIEMVIQYFKDRTESFDDYYPYSKKEKYNLEHVYNSIELFVSMYNYTIVNKNKTPMLTKENLIIS